MKKSIIEFVQSELKKKGLYTGDVDGKIGDLTRTALGKVPGLDPSWTVERKLTGFIQLLCQEHGINPGDVDGWWGQNTEHSYDQLRFLMENGTMPEPWRPEDKVERNPNNWPKQNTQEFDQFYGPRGSSLVRVQLPYPHRLSWDTTKAINSFPCHEKVHDSILRVLNRVLGHYGLDEIKRLRLDLWGGCYSERLMRGGTKWSMHSWGIAIDYDPDRNPLKWGRDKAAFARPEYSRWFEFWEDEGWVSLGRDRNFDWMHVQAAKL